MSRRTPGSLRFTSWNLACPSAARLGRQLEFLRSLDCDVVALQEVPRATGDALAASGVFAHVWQALELRPRLAEETTSRDRGCVVAASARFRAVAAPELLRGAAAPERTLVVRLE